MASKNQHLMISEKFHFQHDKTYHLGLWGYLPSRIFIALSTLQDDHPKTKRGMNRSLNLVHLTFVFARFRQEKVRSHPTKTTKKACHLFWGGPHHRMTAPKSAAFAEKMSDCPRLSEEKGFLENSPTQWRSNSGRSSKCPWRIVQQAMFDYRMGPTANSL